MRLKKIEQVMRGIPTPDINRVCTYRPELFGKHFAALVDEVMRGPSSWSIGERELFATFVSSKNQCQF